MQSSLYQVILRDPSTNSIYELSPKSYEFSEELNKEITAKFIFSSADVSSMAKIYNTDIITLFTAGLREIWINRLDSNNVYQKIFNGVVTGFSLSPTAEGDRDFTLEAVCWFGLLGRRFTGFPSRYFTNTDAGQIAWTLISETQTGDNPYSDLGITQGTIQASKNRDRTYRFENVKTSIIDLSNNNLKSGFDFDIDMTKKFNVYYPNKGQDRPLIIFDNRSLANYNYKKPLLLSLTNRVYVTGSGQDDQILFSQRDADGPTYKAPYISLEEIIKDPSAVIQGTLDDKGDSYLLQYRAPTVQFNAEHYDGIKESYSWLDYNLGDTVRVNFPDLSITNESKRVIRRDFSMQPDKSIGYIKTYLDIPVQYG